jgi:hypothetical protein
MLFVATIPTDSSVQSQSWQNYRAFSADASNKLKQFSGAEPLAENVWLVNMRIDPLPLALLETGAHDLGIAYRLLPFDDAPQWLPAASSGQATLGQ